VRTGAFSRISDVSALAQTADGFPRLGTPTGLPLFDGTRFEPFHSPFGDQQTFTAYSRRRLAHFG
jgi:hypothetical protein